MPDCSYVTITAEAPKGGWDQTTIDHVQIALTGFGWTRDIDPAELGLFVGGTDSFEFEDDDCPWGGHGLMWGEPAGLRTPEYTGLAEIFTAAGAAWEYRDGGHYTWDPSSVEWKPGQDEPVEHTLGQHGQVLMSRDEFLRVLVGHMDDHDAAVLAAEFFQTEPSETPEVAA